MHALDPQSIPTSAAVDCAKVSPPTSIDAVYTATVDAVYMCDAVYVYAGVVCDRRQYFPGPASYMKRELN